MAVGAVGSGVEVRFDAEDIAVGLGVKGRGGERALPRAAVVRVLLGAGLLAFRADFGLVAVVVRVRLLVAERIRLGVGARRQIAFYGSTPNYAFQFDDLGFGGTTGRIRSKFKAGELDTIGDVIDYHLEGIQRLEDLQNHEAVAAQLETELATAKTHLAEEAKIVADQRRKSAPNLAREVNQYLPALALDHASVSVTVEGEDPADEIEIMFRANSGTNWHALSKVATGGELARVMLALRLVLTAGPPTLVFDEVDAGIGGAAGPIVEPFARLSIKPGCSHWRVPLPE